MSEELDIKIIGEYKIEYLSKVEDDKTDLPEEVKSLKKVYLEESED